MFNREGLHAFLSLFFDSIGLDRQKERQRERQTDRQIEIHRQNEIHRQKGQTEIHRQRYTDLQFVRNVKRPPIHFSLSGSK